MGKENGLSAPHGGKLVNRFFSDNERSHLLKEATVLKKLHLDQRTLADIECIATGVYSPLDGFMGKEDYTRVVKDMRLSNGIIWPIPVTLSADEAFIKDLHYKDKIALVRDGFIIAIMEITDIYKPDRFREAQRVYQTIEETHPGVNALYQMGEYYLGGPIFLLEPIMHEDFHHYRLTPKQTRAEFLRRGWRTVVAFQTRNPVHRAHEYLQKVALENVDGLFLNPLVGTTKRDDVPADIRMKTYETLINNYFPPDRVVLGVFPAAMRYAGPRESVMHALARKNYGCTHFIVGRDHAGFGDYYGTYDAQRIFEQFEREELGIEPLKFENAFYCIRCSQMATSKTCPHGTEEHKYLSGTEMREMLSNSEHLPAEFIRPEVAQILQDAYREQNRERILNQKGVTVWFTGLSGAGKTTISRNLAQILKSKNYRVEVLDGDIIRQNLTKGLGYSKGDRDENIRRIGFVSHLLTRNGVIVLVAAISPYRDIRREVRELIGNFIEVYVNAPLEVCEQRDSKGLYKRARAGEIKNFTGIDDPYEVPEAPEVECKTDQESIEESVHKVLQKLIDLEYICVWHF